MRFPLFLGIESNPLITRERLAALLPNEPHDEVAGKEWVSGTFPATERVKLQYMQDRLFTMADKAERSPIADPNIALLNKTLRSTRIITGDASQQELPHSPVIVIPGAVRDDVLFSTVDRARSRLHGFSAATAWHGHSATPEWEYISGATKIVLGGDQRYAGDIHSVAISAAEAMAGTELRPLYAKVIAAHSIDRWSEYARVMRTNPGRMVEFQRALDRFVTRVEPRSLTEQTERAGFHHGLFNFLPVEVWTNDSNIAAMTQLLGWEEAVIAMNKLRLEQAPSMLSLRAENEGEVAPSSDAESLRAGLSSIDESLLLPNANVTYAKAYGGQVFVCRKEHLPTHLERYIDDDIEETLDLVVNLNLQAEASLDRDAWVSGYIPTSEQVELGSVHSEFDAEFERMLARAATIEFTPEEAAMFEEMTELIRSFRWHDKKQKISNKWDIGINFEQPEFQGDCYIGSGHQPEIFLRRDARHPAWLMRAILDLIPVNGKPQDEVWKTSMSILGKLYPVHVIPPYEAGSNPADFVRKVVGATRAITREYPRSPGEAADRIAHSCHTWKSAEATKQLFYEMKPTVIADQEHAWLREHLEMLDPTLLAENPNITYTLPWGSNKAVFVCRKEHMPPQFTKYVSDDNDEALDLVVNLNMQDEHALETDAWVSGTLPSIEELERELFAQNFVAEKFFPSNKEPLIPAPHEEESVAVGQEGPSDLPKPIPRLKALRNTLLKNRWKAQFTVDERTGAPSVAQYTSAEPGHYVLVSLPEAKLQVLISDDHSKGTFIIRNLIDPAEFTRISIDEFLAGYGATRVKWDSPEQFRKGLETEIGEQIRDPITIYPVASSYPTPLDSYPNIEAHAALLRDFELAATQAGKASIDDLTVADFSRIKSGILRWSFGGVAGGAAYLDRIASEFGLDANVLNDRNAHELRYLDAKAAEYPQWSKDGDLYQHELSRLQQIVTDPVEQYEYRERILRTILWDLSESYRATRTAMYEEKAMHGRWHSVSVRKPHKDKQNGNGEPAEAF